MKKIGIISDTHGLLRPEILEILKGCDCIIHAGDVNKPEILDKLRMMGSIYVVRGNNDNGILFTFPVLTFSIPSAIRSPAQDLISSDGTFRRMSNSVPSV